MSDRGWLGGAARGGGGGVDEAGGRGPRGAGSLAFIDGRIGVSSSTSTGGSHVTYVLCGAPRRALARGAPGERARRARGVAPEARRRAIAWITLAAAVALRGSADR